MLNWEEELGKLDELLALLTNAPPSPESEIAREHIQSARCELGAMSAKCELDLELARTATSRIADVATRRNAQTIPLSLPSNRRS